MRTPLLSHLPTRLGTRIDEHLPVDRWGRIRLGAAVAWVALSLVALAVAVRDPAGNALGARVSVVATGLGTAVVVRHQGDSPWEDLTVVLEPGDWQLRRGTMRPGDRLTLEVRDFTRTGPSGEQRAPDDLRPSAVSLATRDGRMRIETP